MQAAENRRAGPIPPLSQASSESPDVPSGSESSLLSAKLTSARLEEVSITAAQEAKIDTRRL